MKTAEQYELEIEALAALSLKLKSELIKALEAVADHVRRSHAP